MAKAPTAEVMPSIVGDATRIVLNARSVPWTQDMFFRLCADNSELFLELTAQKGLVIMSPAGAMSDARNTEVIVQLGRWTKGDKTGIAFGATAGFFLPNSATLSPDAAWVLRKRWDRLTEEEREGFAPLCPDFVVEVRSRRNTLKELKAKMAEYIDNGARLGWLIDPYERKVYIYRPGVAPEILDNPNTVSGDPVLKGFTLDLAEIFS